MFNFGDSMAAGKKFYSVVLGTLLLKISVKYIWFMIAYTTRVSLFCVFPSDDLFIGNNGVLKSCSITMWESICDFKCSGVSFMSLGALVFDAYIFRIVNSHSLSEVFL